MDAPTPRMATVSPSDSDPFPPPSKNNPVVYVLNYHTNFWPYKLAAELHPVYAEQINGLIGTYSNLELAQEAGTKWLKWRTEELEKFFLEETDTPYEAMRATLSQQGWSRVVQQGTVYDIWINGIYPGQSNVTVKVRASIVFGRGLAFVEAEMTQNQRSNLRDGSNGDGRGDGSGKENMSKGNEIRETCDIKKSDAPTSPSDRYHSNSVQVADAPTPYMKISDDSLSEPEERKLEADCEGYEADR